VECCGDSYGTFQFAAKGSLKVLVLLGTFAGTRTATVATSTSMKSNYDK